MRLHLMTLGLAAFAFGMTPRAGAQTPTIVGTWKLNVAESEDTQEKMGQAMRAETVSEGRPGYTGGGRVPVGTGRVSETVSGGGAGGSPSGRGGPSPSSGPVGRIMRPAAQIVLELNDSMIVIKDGGPTPQRIYLDGRTVPEPSLTGPVAEVTAKWKDGKLTVDRKSGEFDTIKETYSIDKKTSRLVIESKVASPNFLRPFQIKRVYDAAP